METAPTALEWFERQAREAQDPLYYHAAQTLLGIAYALNGQFQQAGPPLAKVVEFCQGMSFRMAGNAREDISVSSLDC